MALVPFGRPKGAPRNRTAANPMPAQLYTGGPQDTKPAASGTNRGQGQPVTTGEPGFTVENAQTRTRRTPRTVSGKPHTQT